MTIAMLHPTTTVPADPAIACSPRALDPTQRRRQTELLGVVQGKIQRTVELENGYALELPNDPATALEVAEWVSLERRCCAFAEFAIEWRIDDTLWVKLTGKTGVKEVLAAEMSIGAKK